MKDLRNYYILIVSLFLLLLPQGAWSLDTRNFTMLHLGLQDGLSSQRVFSLCQAPDGAIWCTTKNGIDRSNGSVVHNYTLTSSNKYHIMSGRMLRFVHSTGKTDGLYVFDNVGCIYLYNRIQDRFEQIADVSSHLKKDVVLNDAFIADNAIWLAMREGVYRLNINGKGTPVPFLRRCTNYIVSVENRLLFCANDYVYSYDIKSKKAPVAWLPYCAYSCYYDKGKGKLWLGTLRQGLKVVDMRDPHHKSVSVNLPTNPSRAICPYGKDDMLVGIDGFGVYDVSRSTLKASVLFNANDGREGLLQGNGIYDILVDKWNNIVIGSYSGGIDVARPNESTTAIFRHVSNSVQSLGNNHVNSVAQSGNNLIMCTDDGVSVFNSQTSTWRHTARGIVVIDNCKKPGGGYLLATYGDGVCEMSEDGNVRRLYNYSNGTLKDDFVYSVAYDKAGNLWMGALFGQLTIKTKDGFKYFDINRVMAMCPLNDGRMAVGTSHGLYLLNVNDKKFHELNYRPAGATTVVRLILDLYLAPDGRLWIATDGGGIYIYNLQNGKTIQLTKEEGLPSDCVNNLNYDGHGRIWYGTEKGLAYSYINKPEVVINESFCYGLNTQYCHRAVTNLLNGDILYGTVNGAIIIRPSRMSPLDYKAPLSLRGVRLHMENGDVADNAEAEVDDDFNEKMARNLAKGIVCLDYDQRNFDIFFEAIHLRNQYDVGYQYRLGDVEWSPITDQQYISFANLESGKHELHIRSVSKTSGIVLDEKVVTIYIARPWWSSWWMWCIYLLVIAAIVKGAMWMYEIHERYMRLMAESAASASGVKNRTAMSSETQMVLDSAEATDAAETQPAEDENDDGSEFVSLATKIVLDNLSNTEFSMDDLAMEMGLSRTLFYVKAKTYTGRSPLDFVRAIRLERAGVLLRQGHTVTEVSALTGFDNPKYFSTVFKKYFGVSPSKFV